MFLHGPAGFYKKQWIDHESEHGGLLNVWLGGKKLQIKKTVILVHAESQVSLDVPSVPPLEVLWSMIAVKTHIMHSCSQSPRQTGPCCSSNLIHHSASFRNNVHPQMAQNGVDISDIQRDFLSLANPYHLRLPLVLGPGII